MEMWFLKPSVAVDLVQLLSVVYLFSEYFDHSEQKRKEMNEDIPPVGKEYFLSFLQSLFDHSDNLLVFVHSSAKFIWKLKEERIIESKKYKMKIFFIYSKSATFLIIVKTFNNK